MLSAHAWVRAANSVMLAASTWLWTWKYVISGPDHMYIVGDSVRVDLLRGNRVLS